MHADQPDPELIRDVFGRAVQDVLEDEPEGLDAVTIRRRVIKHPDHDVDPPGRDFHRWLGILCHYDVVRYVDFYMKYWWVPEDEREPREGKPARYRDDEG